MPLLWLCWWDVCHTSEAGLVAGRGRERAEGAESEPSGCDRYILIHTQ